MRKLNGQLIFRKKKEERERNEMKMKDEQQESFKQGLREMKEEKERK